ncbi:hypothetical protein FALCPG4_003495 [Fusarium falciforme]
MEQSPRSLGLGTLTIAAGNRHQVHYRCSLGGSRLLHVCTAGSAWHPESLLEETGDQPRTRRWIPFQPEQTIRAQLRKYLRQVGRFGKLLLSPLSEQEMSKARAEWLR